MSLDILYRTLSEIFSEKNSPRSSIQVQRITLIFFSIQLLSQNFNFLWNPYLGMSYWKDYELFWVVVNYPCIDSLAAFVNALSQFLYLIMTMIALSYALIIFLATRIFYEKTLPDWLLKLLRFCISFTSEMYFIPTTIILILLFKYSTFEFTEIQEYASLPSSDILNYGFLGQVLSVVFILLHLGLSFLYEGCSYEIRHAKRRENLMAKSCPDVDLLVKVIYIINSFCFTNVQITYYWNYMLVATAMYVYCTYKFIYYLPYYSSYVNYLKVLVHFEALCVTVFFLIAYYFKNATIVLVLTVFMQPFIIIFIRYTIEYRMKIISNIKKQIKSNLIVFELAARAWIQSPDNASKLIKYMNHNYAVSKNQLIFVYQANYCSDILLNTALANIKISRAEFFNFKIIQNFQIYKCQKRLETENLKNSEGLKLCLFLLDYSKLKAQEKKFCRDLLSFYFKFFEKCSKMQTLKKALIKLYNSLESLKSSYIKILRNYPESKIIYEMYGSLLADILGESEVGKIYLNRSKSSSSKRKSLIKKLDIFSDKSACTMIVSGCGKSIGKLVYASSYLCNFLDIDQEDYTDYSLSDFIPELFSSDHNRYLLKFVENSLNQYLTWTGPLFLKNKDGFLIEGFVNSECIGHSAQVYFVSIIEPIDSRGREFALLGENNEILCHSRGFPFALGVASYMIKNEKLDNLITKIFADHLINNKLTIAQYYSFAYKRQMIVGLAIKDVCFFTVKVKVVYAINNDKEIAKVVKALNENSEYEISNIRLKDAQEEDIKTETDDQDDEFDSSKWFDTNKDQVLSPSRIGVCISEKLTHEKTYENSRIYMNQGTYNSITPYIVSANKLIFFIKVLSGLSVISLLISNTMVLSYFFTGISKLNDKTAYKIMGEAQFSIIKLAFFSKVLDMSNRIDFPINCDLTDYETLIVSLKNYESLIRKTKNQWSSCPTNNIIAHKILLIWNYNNQNIIEYDNLLDILTKTITNAELFITKYLNTKKNWDEELFYILYNSMRIADRNMQKACEEITYFHIKAIKELFSNVLILLFSSYSLYGITFIVLFAYVIRVNRRVPKIWLIMLSVSLERFKEVKNAVNGRLLNYHNQVKQEDDTNYTGVRDSLDYNHGPRYIMRIFVIFLVALGFYSVFFLVFCKEMQILLVLRYKIFSNILNQGTKLLEVGYYSTEIFSKKHGAGFIPNLTNFSAFSPEELMWENTLNELQDLRHEFDIYFLDGMIPDKTAKYVYAKNVGVSSQLTYGISSAFDNVIWDFYSLNEYIESLNITELKSFLNLTLEIAEMQRSVSEMNDELILESISKLILSVMFFVVGILTLQIALFYVFNYKFFTKEQEVLKGIDRVISMVSQNVVFSIKHAN
ncbi:hypothetical protein SteCoe_23010 [Stentor coeruleus]|uniref:PAS domain-containing protein n=1 Tax=Stentor coeruleus TaxID=5963 RepID=A0A1R2BKV1_9CILI|nr:hypothetical protein SteCoe_23010 [Stentor coeruleus]